jgi:23S rRNA pseudouridine1911/1915/1917 synthase
MEFKVKDNLIRIDQYLTEKTDLSRSKISKMLKDKKILVNNNPVKSSYLVKENDIITMEEYVEEPIHVEPEKMDLDIVYEDDDVIVVNKANGVVVHPAVGNTNHTLVNGLAYHSKLSDINGEFRPGIVHRIDAYTTGLLMIAKNNKAHEILAKELEEKKTTRKYVALVWGVIKEDTGTIDAPIGRDKNDRKKMCVTDQNAKDAITHFKVLKRYKDATLIELQLSTGRTHQIRVHMNYIGHPVVNDPVYGRRKIIDSTGQCLHAKTIGFVHPRTKEYMEFSSELPSCFTNILKKFEEENN